MGTENWASEHFNATARLSATSHQACCCCLPQAAKLKSFHHYWCVSQFPAPHEYLQGQCCWGSSIISHLRAVYCTLYQVIQHFINRLKYVQIKLGQEQDDGELNRNSTCATSWGHICLVYQNCCIVESTDIVCVRVMLGLLLQIRISQLQIYGSAMEDGWILTVNTRFTLIFKTAVGECVSSTVILYKRGVGDVLPVFLT